MNMEHILGRLIIFRDLKKKGKHQVTLSNLVIFKKHFYVKTFVSYKLVKVKQDFKEFYPSSRLL